jgi:integrase
LGSVRARSDTGVLFLDFIYLGQRVREQTSLLDTSKNRESLARRLAKIEAQIAAGRFDYAATFGKPIKAVEDDQLASGAGSAGPSMGKEVQSACPAFQAFADLWFAEKEPEWRRSYRITQRGALDKYLIPRFGSLPIDQISKADLLAFRSELTRLAGRTSETLSTRRVNAVMKPLRQILNEASDRYGFTPAFRNIKPLKAKRSDVQAFSLEEVSLLIASVRADYKPYLIVRLLTGMRTGEANGLKWRYVDFVRRQVLIRESLVLGEDDDLKTEDSQRDILMSDLVFDALQEQFAQTAKKSEYVFCNTLGGALDNKNFVNRVWNPLLESTGLTRRRPYQMRHTAATLWLASGESPEWIARQLGHTTTEMLFRVYSRYVPNLTRSDGSAVNRLLISALKISTSSAEPGAGSLESSARGPSV